jgi:hypothetical protein
MIRTSRRATCLVLTVLILSACGGYRIVRDGVVQTSAAEQIEQKLVAIRGLAFRTRVPLVVVGAHEARGMLEAELHHQYTSDELAAISRVYTALGLLPARTNLERSFLDLYQTQLAGFYDPIERRMVLVNEALRTGLFTSVLESVIRRDLVGELVLAHELTHALQDQHYGIDTGRTDLGEDDAQLAERAVYEGDATLAGYATVLGKLTPNGARALAQKLDGLETEIAREYPDVPTVVRESVVFQYAAGVSFVTQAYAKAGWGGVNALLAHPPRSTEQVLHPEKYFVTPEYPLRIQIGALAPYLHGTWKVAEDATLGELTIRILAERFGDRAHAAAVAAGWNGDRLTALASGDRLVLVWMSAWDTEQDAREFFSAWSAIVATRRSGGTASGADVIALRGADPYYLERRGTKVLSIEGPLEPDLADVADRIWTRTIFEPNVPAAPIDVARTD